MDGQQTGSRRSEGNSASARVAQPAAYAEPARSASAERGPLPPANLLNAAPVSILLGVSSGVAFYVCRLKDKLKTGRAELAAWTVFAALYAAVGASLYSISGNHWMALIWPAQFVFSGKIWGPVVVLAGFAVVAFYVYWLKWKPRPPRSRGSRGRHGVWRRFR